MQVGMQTDKGRVRPDNEDFCWAEPPWFAVADGMGGHAAGEVASRMAIETIKEMMTQTDKVTSEQLSKAVEEANRRIWHASRNTLEYAGMGTTLTVVYLAPSHAMVAHVGDSRCYRLRNQKLQLLTFDHSVVAELVRTGTLSEREAEHHPQRNFLTRALGTSPHVEVDIFREDIAPGDLYLLCTDGLTAVLEHERIETILSGIPTPEAAATQLIAEANAKGGPDNITVVLVQVPPAVGQS